MRPVDCSGGGGKDGGGWDLREIFEGEEVIEGLGAGFVLNPGQAGPTEGLIGERGVPKLGTQQNISKKSQ